MDFLLPQCTSVTYGEIQAQFDQYDWSRSQRYSLTAGASDLLENQSHLKTPRFHFLAQGLHVYCWHPCDQESDWAIPKAMAQFYQEAATLYAGRQLEHSWSILEQHTEAHNSV